LCPCFHHPLFEVSTIQRNSVVENFKLCIHNKNFCLVPCRK
jgi:hypothetical protein